MAGTPKNALAEGLCVQSTNLAVRSYGHERDQAVETPLLIHLHDLVVKQADVQAVHQIANCASGGKNMGCQHSSEEPPAPPPAMDGGRSSSSMEPRMLFSQDG